VKVIPNAAHGVNVDNPQALMKAMDEFYSTVETR